MGTMQRNKGIKGEREVIGLLQLAVFEICHAHGIECPTLRRNTMQSDGGGHDIKDDLDLLRWISIEVKLQEQQNLTAWWAQCIEQAGREREPVLFYRKNRQKFRVRMHGLLGYPSQGCTVVVDVSVEDFLRWFRIRLNQELSRETK